MTAMHKGTRFGTRAAAAALGIIGAAALGLAIVGGGAANAQSATPTPYECRPGTPVAGASGTAAAGAASSDACVAMRTFDIYFDPNLATIPADEAVTVQIRNEGRAVHNFSVTDHKNPDVKNLNISVTMDPGATGTATIDAPAGTYYFFCNQPGHEQGGMFGYLTVETDGAISGDLATVTPPAGS
jgi:uncharacterized cupredoxin-like copper-binding protein